MITVRFFAAYRERLACDELMLEFESSISTVAQLKKHLGEKGNLWFEIMESKNMMVAINQNVTPSDAKLHDGDEIAFFPPVTGG